MTVAEINALSYTPGHSRSQLERAVQIPALSAGWRSSFEALLDRERSGSAVTGNPRLTPAAGPPPAWTGFRPLRVSRKDRESASVTSLVLEPIDGRPLAVALAGRFIVLRLRLVPDVPALLRSYSLRRPPHQPAGSAGVEPLVSFARSGLNVRWGPDFQSLLELAEACDVPVRWACRTGVCHSCETGLINCAVDYPPEPVGPPAEGNALICCGRPQGDIVIDL
jgi:ferredoxin